MTPNRPAVNRRNVLKLSGAATSALLAGCIGNGDDAEDGNGGGTGPGATEATWGGFHLEGVMCWDCVAPSTNYEIPDRVRAETDGNLDITFTGGSELCGEGDCIPRLNQNLVQIGGTAIANATAFSAELDIWTLPYLFPTRAAYPYTLFAEETWERFWIPFAQQHGIVPITYDVPTLRQLYIGQDTDFADTDVRVPSDIANAEIRRTAASATGIAIDAWGATPISIPFGDAVEGLRTGVVDGLETGDAYGFTFGVIDVSDQVVVNNWAADFVVHWASVDWLKQLSDSNLEALANVTRAASEEVVHQVPDVVEQRMGLMESPPDGSAAAEAGLTVQMLTDDEIAQWRDPVDPLENPGLYTDAIENGEAMAGDGFLEYIADTAQGEAVPEPTDFQLDSWWSDHLQEM